jgi:hypothetical protein
LIPNHGTSTPPTPQSTPPEQTWEKVETKIDPNGLSQIDVWQARTNVFLSNSINSKNDGSRPAVAFVMEGNCIEVFSDFEPIKDIDPVSGVSRDVWPIAYPHTLFQKCKTSCGPRPPNYNSDAYTYGSPIYVALTSTGGRTVGSISIRTASMSSDTLRERLLKLLTSLQGFNEEVMVPAGGS